jgi:hypothetical protein
MTEQNPIHKADVVVGAAYSARISGKFVDVRIDSKENRGWSATNLTTGRSIHIKSAAKLRRRVDAQPHPIVEKMRRVLTEAAATENYLASHPDIEAKLRDTN